MSVADPTTPSTAITIPPRGYPAARREPVSELLHGVPVADPYRRLEDADDPETAAWVAAQHELTRSVLDANPWKRAFTDQLRAVWSLRTCHTALKQGSRYFYFANDGTQEQDTLHVMEAPDGEPRLLLDPGAHSDERGVASISYATASPDGRLLAYSLSYGGSDWQEWRVRDVDTGEDLPDRLYRSKFSAAGWNADSTGFFYTRYDTGPDAPDRPEWEPDRDPQVVFHRVGTGQEADEIVYHDPAHPEQGITVLTSEDGAFLILFVWRGQEATTAIHVKDLRVPGSPVVGLLPDFDAAYSYIAAIGSRMWFQTDRDAPGGRIVAVDVRRPGELTEIVPESADAIQGAGLVGGKLYVVRLVDAACRIEVYDPEGRPLGEVPLPEPGTVEGLRSQPGDTEVFYSFTSFTRPATVYRLDTTDDSSTPFFEPTYTFTPADFVVEQVRYAGAGGTEIPMWVCRHRDTPRDVPAPTFLAAYGGFGFAITPSFTPGPITWMLLGGVYALANVRGGGEFGEEWHRAGSGRNKSVAVDDLIGAADWLCATGVARRESLALGGMSNGGMLVAAAVTRRPDLCAAVLPVNGVLDLLRFHRFTIGWSWVFEYGSPDDPDDLEALLALSPLHRIEPGTRYPAALVCTATRDDRVIPAHSYKFAAALQAAQAGDAPVLLRVDRDSGHGRDARAGAGLADLSDRWAFAAALTGLELPR